MYIAHYSPGELAARLKLGLPLISLSVRAFCRAERTPSALEENIDFLIIFILFSANPLQNMLRSTAEEDSLGNLHPRAC